MNVPEDYSGENFFHTEVAQILAVCSEKREKKIGKSIM